jgi:Zn-dependent protease
MAVHESTHAFVSHWLGDTTAKDMGRLTLNPFKHIDYFTTILLPLVLILLHIPPIIIAKPVPFNPNRVKFDEYGAALVGISGPLSNLLLAGIASMLIRVFAGSVNSTIYDIVYIFVSVNIVLFIFNMIPIPPLDGSRLLYAFAPEPLQEFMYKIESAGFFSIIILLLLVITFLGTVIFSLENHLLQFFLG